MKIKICLLTLMLCAAVCGLSSEKTVSATGNLPRQNMVSRCRVSDQTGTPLNVRAAPGGKKIVGKLKNGTVVYVENYSGDAKDQSWAEVRLKRSSKTKPLGWVLQDFLVCEETD